MRERNLSFLLVFSKFSGKNINRKNRSLGVKGPKSYFGCSGAFAKVHFLDVRSLEGRADSFCNVSTTQDVFLKKHDVLPSIVLSNLFSLRRIICSSASYFILALYILLVKYLRAHHCYTTFVRCWLFCTCHYT